ncbi:MAG: hypothetical protein ACK4MJ_05400, partial [Hylemonella sp.]
ARPHAAHAEDARRRGRLAAFVRHEVALTPECSPFDGAVGSAREVAFARVPLRELLALQGVGVSDEPAPLAQRLGLRVSENHGVQIKVVLRGSAAEAAGMAAGDEWVAVETGRARSVWRMHKLDDLLLYAGGQTRVHAWVARDRQLLRLPLRLPPPSATTTWLLAALSDSQVNAWLEG